MDKSGQKEVVVVKMVSGDHLDTAKAVAIQAGIIDEEEA
jgi:magnesium-transporting ATPase (P-type)